MPICESRARSKRNEQHAIVLFDGVCNFCNASVNFIIERDTRDHFRFAALQLDAGRQILKENGIEVGRLDTLLLYECGKIYSRSTAALRIARRLAGAWPLFYIFVMVPVPIRDFFYDLFAKNRYRFFGKRETCQIPTPARRAKFLPILPTQ
jgi:predicted DCC family thiol-disulfide oxidoreductase YuxK